MSDVREDAARCLALLALARARPGLTVAELAEAAHLSEETVVRDLFSTLLLCGVPPYLPHQFVSPSLTGGRVYVTFAEQFRRPVSLTPLEALALKSALEASTPPGGEPPEAARRLVAKIESSMSDAARRRFAALARRFVRRPPRPEEARAADVLRIAAEERRVVEVRYRPLGRLDATTRRLRPLGLFERGGAWYVAGIDPGRGRPQSFRLDRILSLVRLDERFARPKGFSLRAFAAASGRFDDGSRRADVRVPAASAARIRETADPSTWTETAKGLRWRPHYADESAFAAYLAGLGVRDLEVRAPASLRDRVAALAAAARDAHL
ncbi:MAG TPA: WYL domain-containing protein [Planctomycetota bacterium]|nr:WYL domain-containing protein [Planctomycetota bacterium]